MNNKYNVMVTYRGEGTFTFKLRKIGDVEIASHRPVYIYNADIDTINNLRILKRMLIDINIGAKPTGAFRIFNMNDYEIPQNIQIREHIANSYKEPISNEEISSILKGNSVDTKEDVTEQKEISVKNTTNSTSKRTTNSTSKKTTNSTTKKTTSKK